jgi:hypothetical protein
MMPIAMVYGIPTAAMAGNFTILTATEYGANADILVIEPGRYSGELTFI